MLTYCVRRRVVLSSCSVSPLHELLVMCKHYAMTSDGACDPLGVMMQMFQRRFFIPHPHHAEALLKGRSCAYGPLGVDLKRNLIEQWWSSVVRLRPQVFGISSLHGIGDKRAGGAEDLLQLDDLTEEQLKKRVDELHGRRRNSLLQGQ